MTTANHRMSMASARQSLGPNMNSSRQSFFKPSQTVKQSKLVSLLKKHDIDVPPTMTFEPYPSKADYCFLLTRVFRVVFNYQQFEWTPDMCNTSDLMFFFNELGGQDIKVAGVTHVWNSPFMWTKLRTACEEILERVAPASDRQDSPLEWTNFPAKPLVDPRGRLLNRNLIERITCDVSAAGMNDDIEFLSNLTELRDAAQTCPNIASNVVPLSVEAVLRRKEDAEERLRASRTRNEHLAASLPESEEVCDSLRRQGVTAAQTMEDLTKLCAQQEDGIKNDQLQLAAVTEGADDCERSRLALENDIAALHQRKASAVLQHEKMQRVVHERASRGRSDLVALRHLVVTIRDTVGRHTAPEFGDQELAESRRILLNALSTIENAIKAPACSPEEEVALRKPVIEVFKAIPSACAAFESHVAANMPIMKGSGYEAAMNLAAWYDQRRITFRNDILKIDKLIDNYPSDFETLIDVAVKFTRAFQIAGVSVLDRYLRASLSDDGESDDDEKEVQEEKENRPPNRRSSRLEDEFVERRKSAQTLKSALCDTQTSSKRARRLTWAADLTEFSATSITDLADSSLHMDVESSVPQTDSSSACVDNNCHDISSCCPEMEPCCDTASPGPPLSSPSPNTMI